jgi:hypothetical protein
LPREDPILKKMYAVVVCASLLVAQCGLSASLGSNGVSGELFVCFLALALAVRCVPYCRSVEALVLSKHARLADYEERYGRYRPSKTAAVDSAEVAHTIGGWQAALIVGGLTLLANVIKDRRTAEQRELAKTIGALDAEITAHKAVATFSCLTIAGFSGIAWLATHS